MDILSRLIARISSPLLRVTMGIVLLWIGGLKFGNPAGAVALIGASPFAFLASTWFAYLLGAGEIVLALLLFANFQTKYVGMLTMLLFIATLTIFVTTPKVVYGDAPFPLLQLPGEFLLKDLVLFAAGAAISAMAQAQEQARTGIGRQPLPR